MLDPSLPMKKKLEYPPWAQAPVAQSAVPEEIINSVFHLDLRCLLIWVYTHVLKTTIRLTTVVPTKSDSDEILCLQLLSKTLTRTLQWNYIHV